MSHFTTVKTCIRDRECLKMALDDLRLQYEEGDLWVNNFTGRQERVSLMIPTGRYGIGFKEEAGEYQITADWWGVEQEAGLAQEETINHISQRYAYHKLMKEKNKLTQKGFLLAKEEVTEDNVVVVTLRRY